MTIKCGDTVLIHSALYTGQMGIVIASYNSGAYLRIRTQNGEVIEGIASRFEKISKDEE